MRLPILKIKFKCDPDELSLVAQMCMDCTGMFAWESENVLSVMDEAGSDVIGYLDIEPGMCGGTISGHKLFGLVGESINDMITR